MTTETEQYQDAAHPVGSFENRGQTFDVMVPVKIDQYMISGVLINCMEGMFGSWWLKWRIGKIAVEQDEREVWNEYICRNVANGGTLYVWEMDYDGTDSKPVRHEITREKILKAVGEVAAKYPHVWERFGDDTFDIGALDAIGADMIVQQAVLGEVRYG